ncbi:PLASTID TRANSCRIPTIONALLY ACTIVE 14-like protein [Drosera capensis]
MATTLLLLHQHPSPPHSQLQSSINGSATPHSQQQHHFQSSIGNRRRIRCLHSNAAPVQTPPFPIFQPPKTEPAPHGYELADPDFYKIGFLQSFRAYGVEFREGPDGFGVFASKDIEARQRPRMIMEIPLELMLTISKEFPWRFFPDIIPIGHPIFDIINSTNPETDWDLRLACLLLYSFDVEDNFWRLYGDFLPSTTECTSLLLATEEDLVELQDIKLASTMQEQRHRALEFWKTNWDRMLEVMINAGQGIKKGEEMTVDYVSGQENDALMQRYGFSSPENPWDSIEFSGNTRVHLNSFLSVFNIAGLPEEYYHNSLLASEGEKNFVDGAVIAAARSLPTWSDGDIPPLPSKERDAAKALQFECQKMLALFPTTAKQDQRILDSMSNKRKTLEVAIRYRLHRKLLIKKVIDALEIC